MDAMKISHILLNRKPGTRIQIQKGVQSGDPQRLPDTKREVTNAAKPVMPRGPCFPVTNRLKYRNERSLSSKKPVYLQKEDFGIKFKYGH